MRICPIAFSLQVDKAVVKFPILGGNVAESSHRRRYSAVMASLPAPLNLIYSRTQCTSVTSCIGGKFPYKQQSNAIVSHISTRTSRNNRTSNDSLTTNCVSSNSPMVSADDNWGVWTALFATGAFGLW